MLDCQLHRILRNGDRMQIDNTIDAVMALLQLDKFDDRPKIISEMEIAGRLNAGENQFLELGHVLRLPIN